MVHRLTVGRDREKAVFELHRQIEASTDRLKASAKTAWSSTVKKKRNEAVAETKWRLQQIGGLVEQMRIHSKKRHWLFLERSLAAQTSVATLRDTITADPFEDPARGARQNKGVEVEYAVGDFLQAIDHKLFNWMDGKA